MKGETQRDPAEVRRQRLMREIQGPQPAEDRPESSGSLIETIAVVALVLASGSAVFEAIHAGADPASAAATAAQARN